MNITKVSISASVRSEIVIHDPACGSGKTSGAIRKYIGDDRTIPSPTPPSTKNLESSEYKLSERVAKKIRKYSTSEKAAWNQQKKSFSRKNSKCDSH